MKKRNLQLVTLDNQIRIVCDGETLPDDEPVSAVEIEALLGIPTSTTLWFNKSGFVPASAVCREYELNHKTKGE